MLRNNLHLSIANQGGSVQHYFHFLLGFLVPLVIRLENRPAAATASNIFIRSCGPMDRHLLSLNYSNLKITGPRIHKSGVFRRLMIREIGL